jgi:hypothetical protein
VALGSELYTVMFPIPVEWYAVTTSPQVMAPTVRVPEGNAISRVGCPNGPRTSVPSTRRSAPPPTLDKPTSAVPRLSPPPARNAISSAVASGRSAASSAARQSVGTTSNPPPVNSVTPAAAASASRASTASNTSGSPVTSTYCVRVAMHAFTIGRAVRTNGPAQCATASTCASASCSAAVFARSTIFASSRSEVASTPMAAAFRPASTGRSPRATARRATSSPVYPLAP